MGPALAPTFVAIYASLSFSGAHGPVEVELYEDFVAVETLVNERVLQRMAPDAFEPLLGHYYRVTGEMADQVRRGSTVGGLKRLAVYRELRGGGILIADGSIRVALREQVSVASLREVLSHEGASVVGEVRKESRIFALRAATPAQTMTTVQALLGSGTVRWAVPDFIYEKRAAFQPNDDYYGYQWHLDRISASSAWDLEQGNDQIVIAILDSGVELDHPDLVDKLVEPYDALEQDADPTPNGSDAHGTACAALAAATTNNGRGVAGVCPGCSVMPIRIMSEQGWGRYGADSDAFYWAIDRGAQILSNSWGPAQPSYIPANFAEAITYAAESGRSGLGAIVLFASGNEYRQNADYELPSHPLVLGVGATGNQDYRESYSNYGYELDIVAPAGSVTADITGNYGYASGSYSFEFGGTSAATPVAAGIVGLMLSASPGLSRDQVFSILKDTADEVGGQSYSQGFNAYYGYGRVNAFGAVQSSLAIGDSDCVPSPEDCSNGIDDDCDGLIDRDDPACAPEPEQPGPAGPAGAACISNAECGGDSYCYSEADYGIYEGFCGDSCSWNDACDANYSCIDLGGANLCLNDCLTNSECRDGYACHPLTDGSGVCWQSCVHSGCDQGQVCNEYGLCGDRQPPVVGGTEEPEPPQDGDDVDPEEPTQDGADTDDSGLDEQPAPGEEPESPADSSSDLGEASGQTSPEVDLQGLEGGCQSVSGSSWCMLSLFGLVAIRQRRRAGPLFRV